MVFRVTAAAADFLERLAQELDVPASRYEEAESRYHSGGDWLSREESSLKEHSPDVYVQGSFRLVAPIRPVSGPAQGLDMLLDDSIQGGRQKM